MPSSNLDVSGLFGEREAQRSSLHARYLNEQLVRVLKTIGYDVGFQKGQGQYLFDREGARYLDLLSGFGVFAVGRNHPALRQALKSVLDADLPNLVQLDVSTLAGVLADAAADRVAQRVRRSISDRAGRQGPDRGAQQQDSHGTTPRLVPASRRHARSTRRCVTWFLGHPNPRAHLSRLCQIDQQ